MQMLDLNPTAPFGSRRLSVTALKAQRAIRDCPAGTSTQKWKTFRCVCEAKSALGLSDRALSILSALLSFHPEATLVHGGKSLVVFPSNRELALRAHGLAASTLRRHLALLVDAGLIVRRDSPNGKRYARKTAEGDIDRAFGFDLAPLVVRAEEFARLAAAVVQERRAIAMAREKITLVRRDIAKMLAMGVEHGVDADWPHLHRTFRQLLDRRPGLHSRDALEALGCDLADLAKQIRDVLERQLEMIDPTTSPAGAAPVASGNVKDRPHSRADVPAAALEATQDTVIPVRLIAETCPDFLDYARDGLHSARDVADTAALVRPLLGISPSAWDEACAAMGRGQASVTVAVILQRGTTIRNPGGYLRTLARRASAGKFSFWPMLLSLSVSRRREPRPPIRSPFPGART